MGKSDVQDPEPVELTEHWVARNASKIILALLGLAIVVSFISLVAPMWLSYEQRKPDIPAPSAANGAEIAKLQIEVVSLRADERQAGRDAGFKIAAGLAALAAGVLAWARHEQTRNDGKRADREEARKRVDDLRSDREQYSKRFSDAVAMLGEASPEMREGGIYALEQLSLNSPDHVGPIMDVLCSYVRAHSLSDRRMIPRGAPPQHQVYEIDPVCQAAMTVLARSTRMRATHAYVSLADERIMLDLRGAYLPGIRLRDGDLSGARLNQVVMARANLARVSLSRARMSYADLTGSTLQRVDFSTTHLDGANLGGATLQNSPLADAVLGSCNLAGATFTPPTDAPPAESAT